MNNRNNDRRKWISAARILQKSLEVSKKITERGHRSILQIEIDRYRHHLWEVLNPDDEHITAAFFYGAKDPGLDINEAAKVASLPRIGEPQSRLSSVYGLSENSLFTIWSFMEFPENYADPLRSTFSQEQIKILRLSHPPLYEYLEHKRKYHSVAGKLHKLSENEE